MKLIFRTAFIALVLFFGNATSSYSQGKKQLTKAELRIEQRVDSVMRLMTLDEKIGQTVLISGHWDVTGPVMPQNSMEEIKKGLCGNVFNSYTYEGTYDLQRQAVEETRLGIPLLFGYDVIHGQNTIFPISLGEAASWDIPMIERAARVSAIEAAASGIHWTFAPMCDISVEPRWGRVSEGAGEDPFLGSLIAKARVKGYQGDKNDLSDTLTILACVKHFAAYGAPQAGRDYHTVDMSERVFRDTYLPPYKAAIEQGALSIMTSFNEYDGVPATANKYLMTDILRTEWGFRGLVVTDYTATNELIPHGVARDEKHAAELAMNAGVDMDMVGMVYHDHLKELVKEGKLSVKQVDEACRRVLRIKFMLGLFDAPYKYSNKEREKRYIYAPEHLEAAYDMARRSFVLLKNDNSALPLSKGDKIAVIGELANSQTDFLGSWRAAGDWKKATTLVHELKAYNGEGNVTFVEGVKKMGDDKTGFDAAIDAAKKADKIVLAIGEHYDWTGEAASRTSIKIPGVQTDLLRELKKLGKPIVVVLMNGRPLDLSEESIIADAMLETWYAGTKGAKAITDVLFGEYNPSGKLPMTFPRNLGQVPIFYYAKNTGRPFDPKIEEKYKSRYLDCPNDPLYPFGFGLSYTNFNYSDISLSAASMTEKGSITANITLSNTGKYDGEEVVQLYIQDLVGSVTRPLKLLKGFEKVLLKSGESKTVSFKITSDLLAFHRKDMSFGTEKGDFKVYIGSNSRDVKAASFELK